MSAPLDPEQRRLRRIGRLTEVSIWALLVPLLLPVLIGLVVFILVLVVLL
jgi:hypothetical protein